MQPIIDDIMDTWIYPVVVMDNSHANLCSRYSHEAASVSVSFSTSLRHHTCNR